MCGVTTKDNWPGPGSPVRHHEITGEVYLGLPVTDLRNQEVTSKVANRVLDEFQVCILLYKLSSYFVGRIERGRSADRAY
jgi:hypothetical protein